MPLQTSQEIRHEEPTHRRTGLLALLIAALASPVAMADDKSGKDAAKRQEELAREGAKKQEEAAKKREEQARQAAKKP